MRSKQAVNQAGPSTTSPEFDRYGDEASQPSSVVVRWRHKPSQLLLIASKPIGGKVGVDSVEMTGTDSRPGWPFPPSPCTKPCTPQPYTRRPLIREVVFNTFTEDCRHWFSGNLHYIRFFDLESSTSNHVSVTHALSDNVILLTMGLASSFKLASKPRFSI